MKPAKKFLLYLSFFLVPAVLFVVLLFAIPLNKRYAYHFIQNDCADRGSWIHDRIFSNPTPVDIAFIGSSHTKSAIKETVLEDKLQQEGLPMHAANLGYCRFGRNMNYVIIKDLLKHKKVKYLVLEFRVEEERLSHLDFPYVADARDVLAPVFFFDQHYFSDIYEAGIVRFEYFKHKLLHTLPPIVTDTASHSFTVSDQVADSNELFNVKREKATHTYVPTKLENWVNNRFPEQYIQKILTLAHNNGCRVFWVFLPSYGDMQPPHLFDRYKPYGTVLIPPDSIYNNPHNWHDDSHLNDYGAIQFSAWMAQALSQAIKH